MFKCSSARFDFVDSGVSVEFVRNIAISSQIKSFVIFELGDGRGKVKLIPG